MVDYSDGYEIVEQRNKFVVGDEVEFLVSHGDNFGDVITEMYNEKGTAVESAPHAQELIRIKVNQPVKKFDIMRKQCY